MMNRLGTSIGRLLALRQSPNVRVRVAWWVSSLCLLGLLTAFSGLRWALLAIWTLVNIGYIIAAFVWTLFHPRAGVRALLRASNVGMSWAVWLTLVFAILFFSGLYTVAVQSTGLPERFVSHPVGFLFLMLLILCPFVFVLLTLYSLIGLAIGAFASQRSGQIERGARVGGSLWMWVTLGAVTLTILLARFKTVFPWPLFFVYSGLPLITLADCQWALHRPLDRRLRSTRASTSERWFIISRVLLGRPRRLDLRGALLGLLAAAITLLMPRFVIAPLQALALSSLIQMRGIPMVVTRQEERLQDSRGRIVLLDLDSFPRYQALHDRSESAVQADMVTRLHALGAQYIVLPRPLVNASQVSNLTSSSGFAMPGEEDIARSIHDLPALIQAARQAHNVILTLPVLSFTLPFDITPSERTETNRPAPSRNASGSSDARLRSLYTDALEQAALAVSSDSLLEDYASFLPTIPTHWTRTAPVPIVLARALAGGSQAAFRPPSEDEIVNFTGSGPDHDFAHIPYSSLLRNERIFVVRTRPDPASGLQIHTARWVDPRDLVRGHIVFLDSLARPRAITPGGIMTRDEVLAYATATLLSHQPLHPLDRPVLILLTLLLGLVVGASCFKRGPLEALWRVVLAILAVAIASLVAFMSRNIWLDPVVPMITTIAALALATQFTFTQERLERERTRAMFQRTRDLFERFVARDQVEKWLAMPEETLRLGGQRQTVCVLFADVRNFTHFAEQHDAEKVIEVTNKYMGALTEALHRYNGILDKYTGDGLMAWFPIGNDARADLVEAVKAAVAMRDAAIEVSVQMVPAEQLQIGIGLHYGDAVVGLVGCEDLQVNWTALGYTVVVSARLQTIAAGGEVVISEQVAQVISDAFQLVPGEPVAVKGISALVHPYRVVGLPNPPSPFPKPVATLPGKGES